MGSSIQILVPLETAHSERVRHFGNNRDVHSVEYSKRIAVNIEIDLGSPIDAPRLTPAVLYHEVRSAFVVHAEAVHFDCVNSCCIFALQISNRWDNNWFDFDLFTVVIGEVRSNADL